MSNVVVLIGNIVKEVELKFSPGGVAHASFTIAVRRQFKDKQTGEYQSDFISCKIFSKQAEFLANYTKKGSKIAVQGSIQTGSFEASDGTRKYTTDVIVNNVTLLDKKSDSDVQTKVSNENKAPMEITESDLPF